MSKKELRLAASWCDDCQGKKDYDSDILVISSRYWPGAKDGQASMRIKHATGVAVIGGAYGDKASATSELIINHGDDEGAYVLASKDFSHEDGAVVRAEVEQWAQEQMDKVVEILKETFNGD